MHGLNLSNLPRAATGGGECFLIIIRYSANQLISSQLEEGEEFVKGAVMESPALADIAGLARRDLQFEIEQLQYAYVETIDDDRLEELPDLFLEDSSYVVISAENVRLGLPAPVMGCYNRGMLQDRIVSLRQANIYSEHRYRHLISNLRVHGVSGGEASVQTNFAVVIVRGEGTAALYSTGKYVDRVVVADGKLKFKEKNVVFDTHRIDSLLVRPI
jgi:anthranilate 1,2-dioxygenase small subunit